jgi:hypothetical protein
MSSRGIQVVQGKAKDWLLQALNTDESIPTSFTTSNALSTAVSRGYDQAPLFWPVASWTTPGADPTQAIFGLACSDVDTKQIEPGVYHLEVFATVTTGRTACIWRGQFEILGTLGTTVAGKVYGTYADLKRYAAWVVNVQDSEADEATFLQQRMDARAWLDDVFIKSYRGSGASSSYELGMAAQSWAGGGASRSTMPSQWLRDQLDADHLILRPEIVRAVSFKAAGDIGLNQVGFDAKLAGRGAWCLEMAEALASNLVGELDTDGDGNADMAIPVVASNTLYT